MVRFKVVKASHLLLVFAIIVLTIAIAFITLENHTDNTEQILPTATIVRDFPEEEARAVSALASSPAVQSHLSIEISPDMSESPSVDAYKGNILIYHTHTHEAYEQTGDANYKALEAWRTNDPEHNVVQLGSLLADELREKGYKVTHDCTDHELDSMDKAYLRALETLQSYDEQFDLCLDLHRDAYADGMLSCVKTANGTEYAQIMCLVGRGDHYPDAEKPDYSSNLQFARELTLHMNQQIENIGRNVCIKSGRYNQHFGNNSLLVEIGHNRNTLQQAMNSIPVLAVSIDKVLSNN